MMSAVMTAPGSELPSELRSFLYRCIGSVTEVDVLIRLMSGADFTVRALAEQLGRSPENTRRDLEVLAARRLVRVEPGNPIRYSFSTESNTLRRHAALLAEYYETNREAVTRFVLTGAAKAFADAFKLRKEQ